MSSSNDKHNAVTNHKTEGRDIPARRVYINNVSELPHDYSTTPGGTIFSTTPGGTRIIYDRNFLMQMRNSPMARTPPKNLPYIRGVTKESQQHPEMPKIIENGTLPTSPATEKTGADNIDEPQFQMDM